MTFLLLSLILLLLLPFKGKGLDPRIGHGIGFIQDNPAAGVHRRDAFNDERLVEDRECLLVFISPKCNFPASVNYLMRSKNSRAGS